MERTRHMKIEEIRANECRHSFIKIGNTQTHTNKQNLIYRSECKTDRKREKDEKMRED